MSQAQTAYVAGLLEGEGSFFTVTKNGRIRVRVSMQSTDHDVIERVWHWLGGSLSNTIERPGRKPCWGWVLQGASAADLMVSIAPWMGSRRRKKILTVLRAYAESQAA